MLLLLHGFLGQKEDWDPLLEHLTLPATALDLPGHGKASFHDDFVLAIKEQIPQADIVVGYSAGGRLALELKERFQNDYGSVILLSSHLGLTTEEERITRWESDQKWIEKLRTAPFERFLNDWYNQPLFDPLKRHPCFPQLLRRRRQQNPKDLALFLASFSLAKRNVPKLFSNTFFVHGHQDLQYATHYRKLATSDRVFEVEGSGHAVHLENPKGCANIIHRIVNEHC